MKSDVKVIVIASDAALRRSLAFLLEAEGYTVESHETVELAALNASTRSGCVVVDEGCVQDDGNIWKSLAELAEVTILLFSKKRSTPPGVAMLAVEKPFLGEQLLKAVRSALRAPT